MNRFKIVFLGAFAYAICDNKHYIIPPKEVNRLKRTGIALFDYVSADILHLAKGLTLTNCVRLEEQQ